MDTPDDTRKKPRATGRRQADRDKAWSEAFDLLLEKYDALRRELDVVKEQLAALQESLRTQPPH